MDKHIERRNEMNYNEFLRILRGSKQYEFNGTVLEITQYYTGKRIKLDLSLINEDTLELILEDDDEEEEDDEEW